MRVSDFVEMGMLFFFRLIVFHKKENEEDVGNYSPICTLTALHKLFSTILLYFRLYHRLDQCQSEDQGGFGRSYQAIDHLATYRMNRNATSG